MSTIFHRDPRQSMPIAVRGDGCYIVDADGRRYLDACGGAAVSCLGHSDTAVGEAVAAQVGQLSYAHTSFFSTEPAEALSDHLIAQAPDGLARTYFVSGGSEAVEAALKMARQYFLELGQPQRRHFIARWQSYHGNTLGALSVGGNRWRREPYAPMLTEAHHISPCFAYRGRRADESEEQYGQRVADELEAKLAELGPDTVIAFIAEPVVGATAGAVAAVPGYFKRVREICDRHGVLLILDEVMCGMGRTGSLYACEQEGIAPDLLVTAKGLGAGYQPIGAVLCAQKIFDAIVNGSGAFMHGHTYMAHPVACAAALAVQRRIEDDDLLANVRAMGEALDRMLHERLGNHAHVGDIRGRGLFRAVELVADRASKTPFEPSLKLNQKIKRQAMADGLMVYPMGGTVDGQYGDHVLLAPPYIVTEAEVDEIATKLAGAIERAIAEVA
ncbi:MAG: aspartate aminotransferase family protein [Alphaproteobacteria bacterium]